CATFEAIRPPIHPGTASAIRAARPVERRQVFVRKQAQVLLLEAPLVLRDLWSAAAAVKLRPKDQWPGYLPVQPHSSALQAGPSEGTLDLPHPYGKHPDRNAQAADCSGLPERIGHTRMEGWRRGLASAASSPVPQKENQ